MTNNHAIDQNIQNKQSATDLSNCNYPRGHYWFSILLNDILRHIRAHFEVFYFSHLFLCTIPALEKSEQVMLHLCIWQPSQNVKEWLMVNFDAKKRLI